MSRFRRAALFAVLLALVPSVAVACMWDYDTLKMERQRFPSALELITGKFLRHSPEFYEWRVHDRTARLAADPHNPALTDDLAVAFDKLGRHEKAIELMLAADKRQPGRYETLSNLATFQFHAGRLEESLASVEAALRINPDAHFGREKYQKFLTQYVISRRVDGKIKLPLASVSAHGDPTSGNPLLALVGVEKTFAKFLSNTLRPDEPLPEGRPTTDAAAIKGVLGMMRFASHDSPVLLEALGGLLVDERGVQDDAKRLAARAYLKAAYEAKDDVARRDYRLMATCSLSMQTTSPDKHDQISLTVIEAEFQKELAEAKEWYSKLREKELGWIRDGLNADAEFDKLYAAEPTVKGVGEGWHIPLFIKEIVAALVALVVVLALLVFVARRVVRAFHRARASRAG